MAQAGLFFRRYARGRLTMKRLSLRRDQRGQGMAEYIIIVILVAIIVLIGVRLFGNSVINQFNQATGEVDTLR